MLPYILLLFSSAVVPWILYQSKRVIAVYSYSDVVQKRNQVTLSVFFVGLFLLLALRDITVGKDLVTYKSIFEMCSGASFRDLLSMEWELGYTIYNKVIAFIFREYRLFLIVTAFFILKPIYALYSKERNFSFLVIVLFINMPCFLMMFSGLRQAISTSIGILAYMMIEKKKHFWGVALILLAISFHISAVVLFLLYPAFWLKTKAKHLIYIIPTLLIIYFFKTPIFTFIIGFAPSKYLEFYGELQPTGAFGMMILFLVFLAFSFIISDEDQMSDKDYFMRNILLISTMIQFFVPIHFLIQRASYNFLIFVPVAIISIVQAPKKMWKNISNVAVVVMTIFFLLYFFYTALFSPDNLLDVFPYKFFWSGEWWL